MKNKYVYVKNMVSMDLAEYLCTWHLKNYKKTFVSTQVQDAFSIHCKDSEIYYHLLHHLHPRMEKETNLKLKPIFCYSRIYLGGAELEKHTDRKACEISVSITLKYFYQDKTYQWPLCMGDIPINIKSGDGVIYKACEIEHWRPVFQQPKKYWHHQVFVHYVDKNGPFKDLKEELTLNEVDFNNKLEAEKEEVKNN